jgi:DNA-binding NtrC family response regulator
MEGTEILRILKREQVVQARIIIITGYGTIPAGSGGNEAGRLEFPHQALRRPGARGAVNECLAEFQNVPSEDSLAMLIGSSDYMRELKETIRRIAQTDTSVLITGESGTERSFSPGRYTT